jgi:hypothetical protein
MAFGRHIIFLQAIYIYIDMNLYQILAILLLCLAVQARVTNTTNFWKQALKTDTMHYECYSGRSDPTQATNR